MVPLYHYVSQSCDAWVLIEAYLLHVIGDLCQHLEDIRSTAYVVHAPACLVNTGDVVERAETADQLRDDGEGHTVIFSHGDGEEAIKPSSQRL